MALLAAKMHENPADFCGGWNFGPDNNCAVPVGKITDMVLAEWGSGEWVDISGNHGVHEANLLSLDISKAKTYLNWRPRWEVSKAIEKTVSWYKSYKQRDPYTICLDQIEEFSDTSQKLDA